MTHVGVVNTCPRARRTNFCSANPNQCSPAVDDADADVANVANADALNDVAFAAAVARRAP